PLLDVVDQVGHGIADGVAVQVAQRIPALALQLWYEAQRRFQLALQLLDVALDPLLLGGVQPLERLRTERLAVPDRRQRDAHGRAHHRDALLAGAALHALETFLVPLAQLLFEGLPARAVLVALEHRRDCRAQVVHEALHVVAQTAATARGQPHRVRPVRRLEIVHVDPVRRGRLAWRPALEKAPHQRVLAHARRPEGEQIVAVLPDADAEADRLDRPVLADDVPERFEIVGGLEREGRGIGQARERFSG